MVIPLLASVTVRPEWSHSGATSQRSKALEGVYNDEPIEFLAPRGVYNEDVRQNQVVADMVSQAGINAVAFIADDAIREEKTGAGACDWDYQFQTARGYATATRRAGTGEA